MPGDRFHSEGGPTLTFFCKVINILIRQHGNRLMDANLEKVRSALGVAESCFIAMPIAEKKTCRKKRSS